MLGAIENMREGDKCLFAIAIPVGIVIGLQVIIADLYGGIGETLGDEVDLRNGDGKDVAGLGQRN